MFRYLIVLLLVLLTSVASAQPSRSLSGTFIAADDNGVLQVWQLSADGDTVSPLTSAEKSVVDYDVSADGLKIAYTSGQAVWLKILDGSEPFEVMPLTEPLRGAYPVFSADGEQLAFANGGLYLLDTVAGAEPRLLIEDVPLEEGMESVAPVRFYTPLQFVEGTDWLIVQVWLWEGGSVGVMNTQTGEFEELELLQHTELLPLSDGRALIYGNNAVFGDYNLEIAASLDDINSSEVLLDLETVSASDAAPLFVDQAVEIEPGMVRVLGSTFNFNAVSVDAPYFYFDLNLDTGEISELMPFTPAASREQGQTWVGAVSPDGSLIVQYRDLHVATNLNSSGIVFGQLEVYDFMTGEFHTPEVEQPAASFQWQ
jgi:hypothetical protein